MTPLASSDFNPAEPPSPATTSTAGPALVAALLFGAWAFCSIWFIQGFGWFMDQFLVIAGYELPTYVWPMAIWLQAFILGIVALPGAFLARAPQLRACFQTWAIATVFSGVLGLVRFFPVLENQWVALTQAGLSLAAAGVLMLVARVQHQSAFHFAGSPTLLALALVPCLMFPFLLWGALGSLGDTALNLFAGLSLGLFTGVLLDVFCLRPAALANASFVDFFLGSLVVGITLIILGGSFGFNGTQVLLLITWPALGLAAMGLARLSGEGRAWLPLAVLLGLTAAVPLLFVDPEEMTFILGGGEIWQWASQAALITFFVVLVLSAIVGGVAWALKQTPAWPIAAGLAFFTSALGLGAYLLSGQAGFYGERLFVVLKEQADLSHAYTIADRNERLTYVYTTLTDHANTTQANLRNTLAAVGIVYHPHYLSNAIEVEGGVLVRAWLATQPEVDRVIPSPQLRPLPERPATNEGTEFAPAGPQWNLTSIGADRVWDEFNVTGQGIIIGQSDSGVDGNHEAFKDKYRGATEGDAYNWHDPWFHTPSPVDIGGHGTHTLGSILGDGVGVAPGAQWFGCTNLARNLGNPALYLECMEFMLAPWPPEGDPFTQADPARAAHVLNNSWGCPPIEGCDPGSLQPAVAALRAAGIFVVASAGNEGTIGCNSVRSPIALYDEVFSVGAVDSNGDLADFSSRGPVTVDGSNRLKPDIAAPGVGVLSAYPNDTYEYASGTSMAGPHMVGAVALLWSANPALIGDIDRTETILRETASPYRGIITAHGGCDDLPLPNNGVGAGLLDVYAAVARALEEK